MPEQINLASLPKYLVDESAAWELLEKLRWQDGKPVCPHCGQKGKHYFLAARSGERLTRTGKPTYRRLWKCESKPCRRQFSVLVGTVFESSKVPASKWLLALWLMGAGKNGVSALELQRHLGVAYQTAWFIGHRLREAMRREPVASLLGGDGGTVVADETWVGGKPSNKHRQGKQRPVPGKPLPGIPTRQQSPVLALIDKQTGEARARVIADVTGPTLRKAMTEQIDMASTALHTDGAHAYRAIGRDMAGHEYVDHSSWEYVRGEVSTNMAESFFAQFKRSVDRTFHNVSKDHLGRYVDEFTDRWNHRKETTTAASLAWFQGADGKRLTYRPLTGR